MKHILIPTDFSRCSSNALKFALEMARRTSAALHLVHIVMPHGTFTGRDGQAVAIEQYLMERDAWLDRLARRLGRTREYAGIRLHTSVTTGYPVERILEESERVHADLIVLGTTGTSALTRLFIGSTTGGVLEQARVPVLAVPPDGKYRAFSHAALATDFASAPDARSLTVLREVLQPGTEKIDVIHILNRKGTYPDTAVEQRFTLKLNGLQPAYHYLRSTDISGELVNFLETSQVETLVTVSRQRNLLERLWSKSTSKDLASKVNVPLLVLQEA